MEYYTTEKNNDISNFAGKWMELENIILSEATQTDSERQWSHVLIHRWFLNINQRKPAYKPQPQRTSTTMRTLSETYIDLIYMGSRK